MMLNTLTMTSEQEHDARAKAFYLLKKWSSFTYLRHATGLYRNFLDAYGRQLNTPSSNQEELETWYVHYFSPCAVQMEEGLELLIKGEDKLSAYSALVAGGGFSEYLFGRAAVEWMIEHDPFFQRLGARKVRFSNPVIAADYVLGTLIAYLSIETLKCTVGFDFSYSLAQDGEDGRSRIFHHWNYESLFQEVPQPGWPNWPPGRHYPATLPPCPPRNESSTGEIYSGQTITQEGIWEPWLPTGKVGCPNYFPGGSVAHKYRLEGTDEEQIVRWRLLWEDTRYQGGRIPEEEDGYFPKPAVEAPLRALPGEPCPRTGHWHSPALKDRIRVEAGMPMPGPQSTSWGMVIWQYSEPHSDD
ncbi:Imm72 family immunity protein [Paraburkholderia bannensis]|uniref:Imm72 family immunity protein n=1 Tax=Paraburkholderia bannensis TaxID=765414 RepID=UPI002AB7BC71|nr:Imm72 family immunity protein [Paraburkholderia bannensis]